MLWVVLDTTTLISDFGWGGHPGSVLEQALEGRFLVVTSPALLEELGQVMAYEKFAGIFESGDELLLFQEMVAVVVEPSDELILLADEPDNRVLEAAVAADADYIVTGDRQLLALERMGRTEIVTAADFLRVLASQAP